MPKFYLTFGLAALVGFLTICSAVSQQARMTTVLYRAAVSMIVFAACGYLLGAYGERAMHGLLARFDRQRRPRADEKEAAAGDAPHPAAADGFVPFTPGDFQKVNPPDK